jgi:hypothetical protein
LRGEGSGEDVKEVRGGEHRRFSRVVVAAAVVLGLVLDGHPDVVVHVGRTNRILIGGCGSRRAVGIVDPVDLNHVVVDKLRGRVVQQEDVPVAVAVAGLWLSFTFFFDDGSVAAVAAARVRVRVRFRGERLRGVVRDLSLLRRRAR